MIFTLDKKNTIIYYIAIALIAMLLAFFYFNSLVVKSTEKWVEHTNIIINKNNEILLNIVNVETGVRGYILTDKKEFLKPYYESKKTINQNLAMLQSLTIDHPNQHARVKELNDLILKRLTLSKSLIENKNTGKEVLEMNMILQGKVQMDAIRKNINTINREEIVLLNKRKTENSNSINNSNILLVLFFILVLTILVFIYFAFKNHRKVNSELESFNKLQQAASQYSLSLIEASLDPLVTINNEGKITDLNQATENVTGLDRAHLIGSDFFDYFTEHQKAREVYQEVFSKGSVTDAPLTIRHKDGKLTEVLFNGSVYKDEAGNTKGVVIVARDIAEQKWALDLRIANTELAFQNEEKEKRANELVLANKELEYQNSEKEERANELLIANEELAYQNQEKENRANELTIANKELEYQNRIKEKKAQELIIANKELLFQTKEKKNRADELEIADIELTFQNEEKEKRIIESKKLEAYNYSLKLASQYSRSLIEASLDPLVTISAEGKITDVNNASVKVTGVEREKLVGTDFSDYFTEPKEAQEGYRQAFENGFVEDYPLTIKHTNGKLTDVLYNASVYKDDNDNVLGVFAAARDITEQNKQKLISDIASKNLEESNNSLKLASQYSRSLIEASLDPLVTISAEGKITDVNNASIKVTGVEREKLVGTDFSDYFTEPKKAQEGYRQVFENGFVEDYPLTIKHIDGKLTDVLYNASVYKDDKNNVLGVFAAARDVTYAKEAQEKLQASEERIRLATTASGVGVWEWNVITNKIRWDAQMFRIYGVAPTADGLIEYSTWSNTVAPEDLAVQEKILEDTVKNIATSNRSFKIYRANDGMQCFIESIETVRINAVGQAQWVVGTNLDVTEQKQASQYARSLIEASLDPLVTISAEGIITDVNNASIEVTGVTREKLVGTDFSDYFTEPKMAQEGYRKVFQHGFVEDYPLTIKHIDGKLTDVLYNASVYKDDNDNVLGVFAAARDITEQNKQKLKSEIASKSLEASNDSLKLASQYSLGLIESSRDPMFVISVDGKITDTNQATVNATDVSKKNLFGSDFISYFTDPEKAKKGYQEIFSKGFVVDFPLVIKDHKLTDVLFNGAVYKDDNDVIVGAVAVARDITEQKKAERALLQSLKEVTDYKLALDASTIVDITDKNGKILYVNDNYLKISKYSNEELIGGNHKLVNSSFHPVGFMKNLWDTISQGKVWQDEIRNKDKYGQYYWLNMTIVPFLDEQGNPSQYVAISIDITNQKVLEIELTEAKVFAESATIIAEDAKAIAESATIKAEEAVKSKQQFLSNMSHEIRTPMNAIIGFTKVVLKTELTAKQKEYLTAIKMSGDALIVLINDILDLAKVDSGKMTFEKIPFKLNLSIKAMLHLFETKIQEKNLKLVTHYDKKIPEVLVGDPLRLHQIILNLVSNAVKFTQEGKITVSVSLESENATEVTLKFAVTDTGIGIKEKKMEQIFENFQQATSGTSRIFGGTGLGLAIVKQLVQAQNGTIEVKSQFGKGSTFSFVLNFEKTLADAVLEPEIIELNTDIKDTKILVVEDMELNQLLMKTLLDDFGFECEIAANGKIAIEKLQHHGKNKPFDIVLMDLQMPEMNGFDATEYIRKTMKSNIPIIALTADVTTVDISKCKAVGMNDYISKPVDERLLYSKLVGLIKKPILIIEQKTEGNLQTSKVKYVDMTYLLKLTKSNPKLMSELINSYLRQTPVLIKTMKKSFHDKDWKLLNATIHKMLPSFNIMGMSNDITAMAKKIQEYSVAIELSHELGDLVLELEEVCLQTIVELEDELINLK